MVFKEYLKRGFRYILTGVPEKKVTAEISSVTFDGLLKGKAAIVTGGTSGIGLEIVKSFLKAGVYVIFTGRSQERLNQTSGHLLESDPTFDKNFWTICLDNTKVSEFEDKFKEIISHIGNDRKIDILVNNAGILGSENFGSTNEEEYDQVMNTNLKGAYFLSQIVAKYMKDNQVKGNILNIASSSSLRPASSAYTLSKWGIRGMTAGLAKSLIPYGIVVNAIAPGPTMTPMLIKNPTMNIASNRIPSGRFVMPKEIADMAVVLVSNMGRSIVGDTIFMTGGAGVITYDDIDYCF